MKPYKISLVLAVLLTMPVFLFSFVHASGIDGGYVGTDACLACHNGTAASDKTSFIKAGHPYKYRHTGGSVPVDDITAQFATPPVSQINTLTVGDLACGNGAILCNADDTLSFAAVNYAIGGFGWKIRWGVKGYGSPDNTGYVWAGTGTQYNLKNDLTPQNDVWSAYNSNTDKKYSCAICHNTNGTSSADSNCTTPLGSGRTEPWASNPFFSPTGAHGGYYSEWTFDGVQCEACHGPGSNPSNAGHADNPSVAQGVLQVNGAVDICAKCHSRSNNNANSLGSECGIEDNFPLTLATLNLGATGLSATSDFIGHHEQYNELIGVNDGVHRTLSCVDCHDPHKRAITVVSAVATALDITDNDQSAEARGAVASCSSCHPGKTLRYNMGGDVTCVDCHMAEATKSAINYPTTGWGRRGDQKTHIFKINPTASKDSMRRINVDGKTVAQNYITPEYACGKCHDPAVGGSYSGFLLTLAQAQTFSQNIHGAKPTARFSFTYDGATSYQVNFDASLTECPSGTCDYSWNFGDGSPAGSGVTTSHVYSGSAGQTVVLTVSDTVNGTSDTESHAVTPQVVNHPPVASFNMAFIADTWTATVTDTSTDSESNIKTGGIRVLWGDGASSTGNAGGTFNHTYTSAGTFTINLRATDTGDLYSEATDTVSPANFSVSGGVLLYAGASATLDDSVLISLKQGATTVATTYTNTSGAYSFSNVKPGTYDLTAYKSGVVFVLPMPSGIVVGPNSTGNNFQIQKNKFKITSTALGSGGAPIAGVTITVKKGTQLMAQGLTNASGVYATGTTLPAGTYTVTAAKYGRVFSNNSQSITFANGDADGSLTFNSTTP